jgi:hypothetical protein
MWVGQGLKGRAGVGGLGRGQRWVKQGSGKYFNSISENCKYYFFVSSVFSYIRGIRIIFEKTGNIISKNRFPRT